MDDKRPAKFICYWRISVIANIRVEKNEKKGPQFFVTLGSVIVGYDCIELNLCMTPVTPHRVLCLANFMPVFTMHQYGKTLFLPQVS